MTDEEKAEENYIKYRNEKCEITRNTNNHLHKDWRKSGVDRHKAYIDGYLNGLAEGRKEGYEQGMKKVCEICEQHMLEEHPNACGCAFRRLGNEYCWEFKK